MAQYRISGVWKNASGTITHYAMHTVNANGSVTRASKTIKAQAIILLDNNVNTATTWIWNYRTCGWMVGENVHVVNGVGGKYLRTDPDKRLTDNLRHLINFERIAP
jgi:hypothetical protein